MMYCVIAFDERRGELYGVCRDGSRAYATDSIDLFFWESSAIEIAVLFGGVVVPVSSTVKIEAGEVMLVDE